jgi:hypothetical protein
VVGGAGGEDVATGGEVGDRPVAAVVGDRGARRPGVVGGAGAGEAVRAQLDLCTGDAAAAGLVEDAAAGGAGGDVDLAAGAGLAAYADELGERGGGAGAVAGGVGARHRRGLAEGK